MKRGLVLLALALCVWASTAEGAVVYSNDFGLGDVSSWTTTFAGGVTTDQTPIGSNKFLGRNDGSDSQLGFTNDTARLTLMGLSAHSSVTLAFDLYVINSWDGNGSSGGERFTVAVGGGPTLQNTGFANNDSKDQCFPSDCPASNPTKSGAASSNTLGYNTDIGGDAVYHLMYTFGHTDSTLVLNLTGSGLQDSTTGGTTFPGITDESWGIDNVSVAIAGAAVPEPGTLVLLGSGLACAAVSALRRRPRIR